MLVQPEDLFTELYPEVIDQITRNNPEEVITQIKAAESFVKGYLFKYDLKALFGTDEVNPTHPDENLKKIVKIVASYWLVRKSNPGVSYEVFREDWDLMIGTRQEPGWLTDIKEGKINPPGWPLAVDDPDTPEDEGTKNNEVHWTSITKRTNHF